MSFQPNISTATFVEILQDDTLVREDELRIFQMMHAQAKQEASATDLAQLLAWMYTRFQELEPSIDISLDFAKELEMARAKVGGKS